jgi:hypothetical protein
MSLVEQELLTLPGARVHHKVRTSQPLVFCIAICQLLFVCSFGRCIVCPSKYNFKYLYSSFSFCYFGFLNVCTCGVFLCTNRGSLYTNTSLRTVNWLRIFLSTTTWRLTAITHSFHFLHFYCTFCILFKESLNIPKK